MGNKNLEAYRRKRNFEVSPEPSGDGHSAKSGDSLPRFVVQKHQARALHYDLRLEMDGVLRSWAVPKGPSLDPAEKRLAINVEDHPLEYADFEGVIPEGQYGAGQVIVWDRGTYQCIGAQTDPVTAWEKGTIDVRLQGRKLQGMWLLVRLKKGTNEWLLFKKQDEYAHPGFEITEEQPESVLSGLRVEDVTSGNTGTWNIRVLRRLAELELEPAPLNERIQPMLASLHDEVPKGGSWTFELKYDGVRTLAEKRDGRISLYSRNMKPLDEQFPEIIEELATIPANEFVLDGEIVALDEGGKSSFQLLQGRLNRRNPKEIQSAVRQIPTAYMVFDLPYCEGYDLRPLSLRERREVLQTLLPDAERIRRVSVLEDQGEEFYRLACAQGLEGILAKSAESRYESKRSSNWLKVKCFRQENFVICGFTNPSGGRQSFGALLVAQFDARGDLVFRGRVGTGFTQADLGKIHHVLAPLITAESPLSLPPGSEEAVTWVDPRLVCRVQYSELTRDGILRAPSFLGMVPEANPLDCRSTAEERALEVGTQVEFEESLEVESGEPADEDPLREYAFLSNLDKVFWPEDGYTKRDLVMYYHEIAPVILPYLRDRPMNLERYPDGYQGKSFYQKDVPDFFPDWIRTAEIQSEDKISHYAVCDDRQTLVYLANLACIPLHPWSSRVETLDFPDFLIIDLDPDPEVGFPLVCQFAQVVRRVLDQLELTSFPKTSGSKGIHILVPLKPEYDYAVVRGLAEIIARLAVHGNEELATFDRSMKSRRGRIYVDYLQNGKGKTIVSPYCVRPRAGAPVSTPLEWGEVGPGIRPDAFHIKNVFRRIDRKGDLFAGLLAQHQAIEGVLERLEGLL